MSQPVEVTPPAAQPVESPAGEEFQPDTSPSDVPDGSPGKAPPPSSGDDWVAPEHRIRFLPLDVVGPNPHQPRGPINEGGLSELAASIRTAGVMQPILVRPVAAAGDLQSFEIVAGERRWRAARLAGLESIPAIIREVADQESAEWAIVENVQREDLNPIEKAEAFRNLIDEFGLTQSQVAERVGIDRSSVANLLRLNQLDPKTKDDIRAGRLTQGHAKALLSIPDDTARRKMAEASMLGFWSVRELEKRVERALKHGQGANDNGPAAGRGSASAAKPEHIRTLEYELSELLGVRAEIRLGKSKNAGSIQIAFSSVSEFENLLEKLRQAGEASHGPQ